MINSGIMRMFIFFYNFYIYIFYFVSQVLCIYTNNYSGYFSMTNIYFFFYLIIWRGIGIASESKLEVLKGSYFGDYYCFYYFFTFLFNYFILLLQRHPIYLVIIPIHIYMWVKAINLLLELAQTVVFVWRWTHTRGHWIISWMTSILKIVLWMFQKMCISEFDILFVIYFYLLIWKYYNVK
jgi:hypothetical protein